MHSHIVIPDVQAKPDIPTEHLPWIGEFIAESKPTAIVCIGDFADMASLSTFDQGKRSFEGRRYIKDIDSARAAMELLTAPIKREQARIRGGHRRRWNPSMDLTLGNHEGRITRAINNDARLDGTLGLNDLGYEDYGWTVHDFLKPVEIDSITYSHYFPHQHSGRPVGGTIDSMLKTLGFSFTQGHLQTLQTGSRALNTGNIQRGIVAGSCYLHDEDYKGPQGNGHWRGILLKTYVGNGNYDLTEISLDTLCRRYEGKPLWRFMEKWHKEIFDGSIWLQRAKKAHHV